jgi:hypothetical protein
MLWPLVPQLVEGPNSSVALPISCLIATTTQGGATSISHDALVSWTMTLMV